MLLNHFLAGRFQNIINVEMRKDLAAHSSCRPLLGLTFYQLLNLSGLQFCTEHKALLRVGKSYCCMFLANDIIIKLTRDCTQSASAALGMRSLTDLYAFVLHAGCGQ